jgi:hypothetical protein
MKVPYRAAHKLAHVQSQPHLARHSLLTARAFSRLLGSRKACIASAEEAPKTAATAAAAVAGVDTAAAAATAGAAKAGRFARGMCACGGGGSGSCSGSDKLLPAAAATAAAVYGAMSYEPAGSKVAMYHRVSVSNRNSYHSY